MRVLLKNNWFGPEGEFFTKNVEQGTEIPDKFIRFLPSTARPFGSPPPAPVIRTQNLRDFDPARAAGEAEDALVAQANEQADTNRAEADARRAAFAAALKAEKAAEKAGK